MKASSLGVKTGFPFRRVRCILDSFSLRQVRVYSRRRGLAPAPALQALKLIDVAIHSAFDAGFVALDPFECAILENAQPLPVPACRDLWTSGVNVAALCRSRASSAKRHFVDQARAHHERVDRMAGKWPGGERAAGELPGGSFSDVTMVELRDIRAALHMEQIRAFLPLSRWWLELHYGIRDPKKLMLLEADEDQPPQIRRMDLPFGGQICRQQVVAGEGLYVFSVPTGLAERRVEVGLTRGFVVAGPGISEDLEPNEIGRLLVGKVIFRE